MSETRVLARAAGMSGSESGAKSVTAMEVLLLKSLEPAMGQRMKLHLVVIQRSEGARRVRRKRELASWSHLLLKTAARSEPRGSRSGRTHSTKAQLAMWRP